MVSDNGPITTACSSGLQASFGGSNCRFYKVVLPAGNVSANINWDMATSADMGVFLVNAAGTSCVATLADNQGGVTGDVGDHATQPLNCAENGNQAIAAGTYLIAIVRFTYTGTTPAWYQFRISQP